jgi:hypothetical protein
LLQVTIPEVPDIKAYRYPSSSLVPYHTLKSLSPATVNIPNTLFSPKKLMTGFQPNATRLERAYTLASKFLTEKVRAQCEKVQELQTALEEASKAISSKELLEDDIIASRASANELKEAAEELASRVGIYYKQLDEVRKALGDDTF